MLADVDFRHEIQTDPAGRLMVCACGFDAGDDGLAWARHITEHREVDMPARWEGDDS